jgi:Domain of unknown function (DUF4410)
LKVTILFVPVRRAWPEPPANALTVYGDFTAVEQADKTAQMVIGFGRRASDVKAHGVVSLVTQGTPIVLAEFNLDSESGKKPGDAATMGVGSAGASVGASGATESKASVEGDASRRAVSSETAGIMVAQQWIAPMTKNKEPSRCRREESAGRTDAGHACVTHCAKFRSQQRSEF